MLVAVGENAIVVAVTQDPEISRRTQFFSDQAIDIPKNNLGDEIHQNGALGYAVGLSVAARLDMAVDLVA